MSIDSLLKTEKNKNVVLTESNEKDGHEIYELR